MRTPCHSAPLRADLSGFSGRNHILPQFIGLSWTRPVPWKKFHSLSRDIAVASQQSRTIRYQRAMIRRDVRAESGTLIIEIALIGMQPDRATPDGMAALEKDVAAQPKGVISIYIDFAAGYGWRNNRFLAGALRDSLSHPLYPDPLVIDGMIFDPISHFRAWRDREDEHVQGKIAHARRIIGFLEAAPQRSNAQSAAALNETGLHTHGGKLWAAENLGKLRKLHSGKAKET